MPDWRIWLMRKQQLWMLPVMILAVLVLFSCAAASAAGPDVWVSVDGSLRADAIMISANSGSGYSLFLPANLDTNGSLCFGVADNVSFSVKGKQIHTGDSAAFLKPGSSYSIKINKKSSTLKVYSGSEGLPAVYITTESGKLNKIEASKNNRESGWLILRAADGTVQGDSELEHIKIRGNSSVQFAKKNYQIKLTKGADLLGMGKAKKWILTGNYRDKANLRNMIMMDLAAAIGVPYTPQHTFAELYINHEYRGLYLFSEKVEIDGDRIDINDLEKDTEKLNEKALSKYKFVGKKKSTKGSWKAYQIENNPEDITGGYLLEYEKYPTRYADEASAYTTKKGAVIVIKSPEYVSVEQMKYISSLVQSFENAITNENGTDPDTGKHYTEIADLESLALKYMIEEISENYDGNSSSQYFFKPEDEISEKLFAGPVWDYDSTFGSYAQQYNAKKVLNPEYLWIASGGDHYAWYPSLYRQADFRDYVGKIWNDRVRPAVENLLGIRSDNTQLHSIDEYAGMIEKSVEMDRIRWPRQKNASTVAQTGYSFKENVRYLKDYLKKRYEFLNKTWIAGQP